MKPLVRFSAIFLLVVSVGSFTACGNSSYHGGAKKRVHRFPDASLIHEYLRCDHHYSLVHFYGLSFHGS